MAETFARREVHAVRKFARGYPPASLELYFGKFKFRALAANDMNRACANKQRARRRPTRVAGISGITGIRRRSRARAVPRYGKVGRETCCTRPATVQNRACGYRFGSQAGAQSMRPSSFFSRGA